MNRAEVKRRQVGEVSNILMLVTIWVIGGAVGDNGVAYVAVAVEVCALLWSAVGGSLSDTMGKLLRSRRNKGQYRNAARMRSVALIFHAALGLAGSLLLFFSAGWIASGIFHIRYSEMIIRILSPILLFRALSAALLGGFQGKGVEFPAAVAGVLRQLLTLGFSLLFTKLFRDYGEKVSQLLQQDNYTAMYSGMGVSLAIVLAEGLIALALAVFFKLSDRSESRPRQDGMYTTDSFGDCVRYLCGSRWPHAMAAFLGLLPLAMGLVVFSRAVEDETEMARGYGLYLGQYLVPCGVAVFLISIAVLPVTGRTFASLRRDENRYARTVFQGGMHICLVHGIFAAVFLAVMGSQVAELLCPEGKELVLPMLQGGSCVVVFTSLSLYFGRFLLAAGRKYVMLSGMCAADVAFLATLAITQGSKTGVLSLVYAGIAGTFAMCVLLGLFSCSQMRARVDWLGMLIVPAGAGGVCGLISMFLGKIMSPHLGSLVTLLLVFLLASVVYWIILLVLRNFREQELETIAGGRLILALGQMLRVY